MKIVVMSDTHLYEVTDAFEAICSKYCRDADLVIHLGDWASSCVADFMEQYRLEAVAGNMDDALIKNQFPDKKVIRVGKFRLGIIHGWDGGGDIRNKLRREFSNVDAILYGHTHRTLELEEDGMFWFNPGSVFLGRGNPPKSLGILRVDESIRSEIISL